MDRDRKGGPPPEEFGSFDVAKMSEADVAAEIARRMADWRRAHKQPDQPAHGVRAAAPGARPRDAEASAADRPALLPGLGVMMAARVDRARRIAAAARAPQTEEIRVRPARQAPAYGGEFRFLLAEGPNVSAIRMGRSAALTRRGPPALPVPWHARAMVACQALRPALEAWIDQAQRRARAIGAAARARGSAAWRSLVPALHQAKQRIHAFGVTARERSVATWQELKPVLANRIRQAQQRAHAIGVAAQELGIAAWQQLRSALGQALRRARVIGVAARERGIAAGQVLASRTGQALQRAHAIGVAIGELTVAAWQAPASRPVMAGATAIAIAIAAWCLMQPHAVAPIEIAAAPQTSPAFAVAGAPVIDRPLRPPAFALDAALLAPAKPPPPPEADAPDEAGPFLAPMLKPALPPPTRPTLIARLKPPRNKAAPVRQEQRETQHQKTAPPAAPLPAKQTQGTTDEPRKRADPRAVDSMLDDMFSNGLGRSLSRRWQRR